MIPKVIHYCWFGRNPKPKLAKRCIKSWKRFCPDYKIIEWNEDNFDLSACPLYVQQAYMAKKWAFVTDYVRLKVVYENGGIYMDTDVELKKKLDSLLQYNAYFGYENGIYINTGLGFGAQKGLAILQEMMKDYQDIPFVKQDGSFDLDTCLIRNTKIFVKRGLCQDDTRQILKGNILILPTKYLCPIDYRSGLGKPSRETISVHWYAESWKSAKERAAHSEYINRERKDYILHIPNRIALRVLGEKIYNNIKQFLKKKSRILF